MRGKRDDGGRTDRGALAVALAATLRIPGYWTPALVGAVLFLVGALFHGHAATVTVCYDDAVTDLFETLVDSKPSPPEGERGG
jgi:hypothetical protein